MNRGVAGSQLTSWRQLPHHHHRHHHHHHQAINVPEAPHPAAVDARLRAANHARQAVPLRVLVALSLIVLSTHMHVIRFGVAAPSLRSSEANENGATLASMRSSRRLALQLGGAPNNHTANAKASSSAADRRARNVEEVSEGAVGGVSLSVSPGQPHDRELTFWDFNHLAGDRRDWYLKAQKEVNARWRSLAVRKSYIARGPSFFLVGFAKCGSTSLFASLTRNHPSIVPPVTKEVKYYNQKMGRCETIPNEPYLEQFPLLSMPLTQRKGKITGDGTPIYAQFTCALERIAEIAPHPKFIFLIRDPVARLVSNWRFASNRPFDQHIWREQFAIDSALNITRALRSKGKRIPQDFFDPFVARSWFNWDVLSRNAGASSTRFFSFEDWGDVRKGFYLPQLIRYITKYGLENVLVVQSERLFHDRVGVIRMVERFLGVDPDLHDLNNEVKRAAEVSQHHHLGDNLPPPTPAEYEWARTLYRFHTQALYKYLEDHPTLTGGIPFAKYPWSLSGPIALDPDEPVTLRVSATVQRGS